METSTLKNDTMAKYLKIIEEKKAAGLLPEKQKPQSSTPEDHRDTKQIIPAVGWRAAYYDKGKIWTDPVIAFGLFGSKFAGHDIIAFINGNGEISYELPNDKTENFLGFLSPGQRIPRWMKRQAKASQNTTRKPQSGIFQLLRHKLKTLKAATGKTLSL